MAKERTTHTHAQKSQKKRERARGVQKDFISRPAERPNLQMSDYDQQLIRVRRFNVLAQTCESLGNERGDGMNGSDPTDFRSSAGDSLKAWADAEELAEIPRLRLQRRREEGWMTGRAADRKARRYRRTRRREEGVQTDRGGVEGSSPPGRLRYGAGGRLRGLRAIMVTVHPLPRKRASS